MTAFDIAWDLMKMAWKPDSFEPEGLWGDQQGPHPEPLDAGLYKPSYAHRDPDYYHKHTYDKTGKKKNKWTRYHDQDWVLNPNVRQYIPPHEQRKKPIGERQVFEDRGGKWMQVDRMMKPLLEELWGRGITTKFSDSGGDLRENPLYQHNEELEEQSVFGAMRNDMDDHDGYLWFGSEGIPEQARHFPKKNVGWDIPKDTPWIDAINYGGRDRNPDGETIRWQPSDDLSNLRQLYDAFGVAFPDEYMKDGGYQWR